MKTRLKPQQAMIRLEDLCARAEHCPSELRDKLYRWGVDPSHHDEIIDSLIDRRFVDEERFTRAFVRDKMRFAGWGRRKIAAALALKRLPRQLISEMIEEEIDEDEYVTHLDSMLRSRIRRFDGELTREDFNKLIRAAMARGFESDLAISRIKHLLRELSDETDSNA